LASCSPSLVANAVLFMCISETNEVDQADEVDEVEDTDDEPNADVDVDVAACGCSFPADLKRILVRVGACCCCCC